jgi:hypothetical protein
MSATITPEPQYLMSQSQLDGMQMWIYIGVMFAICFFVLLLYFLQDKFRTPKQSNNLTTAHRKHIPLFLMAGLDHYADLIPLKELIPQVLESFPFGKGPKKRTYRFTLPQKVNIDELNIDVAEGKNERVTKQYIQALNDLNTMQITLRGVNAPIFAGTKNRTIAASFPFLSALNWTKDIELLVKDQALIEAFCNHKDSRIRNVGEVLSRMSFGVSAVDFHAVYKNIDANYDPTTDDSLRERDRTDGRLERNEDKEKQTKTILLLILGIIGVIVAGGIVIAAIG